MCDIHNVFLNSNISANDLVIKLVSLIVSDEPEFLFRPFYKPITLSFFSLFGVLIIWVFEKRKISFEFFTKSFFVSFYNVVSVVFFNFALIYGQSDVLFIVRQQIQHVIPIFLQKSKIRGFQLFGISISVIGIIICLFSYNGSFWFLIIVAVSQALRIPQAKSELLLVEDHQVTPVYLMSSEAFIGILITTFIIFPIGYVIPGDEPSLFSGGSLENFFDSISMIFQTPRIILGVLLVIFASFIATLSLLILETDRRCITYILSDLFGIFGGWFSLYILNKPEKRHSMIFPILSCIFYALSYLIIQQFIRFKFFNYSEWMQLDQQETPMDINVLEMEDD